MSFSRAELVDSAFAAGFPEVSDRLITEWARLGLLDAAQRVTREDGRRGARYVWPDTQRDLFLTLLSKRKDVRRTSELVVVPVAVWLYWGDEWIPARQIRRALTTSLGLFGEARSWTRANATARSTVAQLFGPGGIDCKQKELQRELTERLFNQDDNLDDLLPLVRELLLQAHGSLAWGPFRWDETMVVDALRVTMVGISMIHDLRDSDLIEARARQRDDVLGYLGSWVQFAAMPDFGSMFQRLTLEMLVQRSCRDLLLQLGKIGIARQRNVFLAPPTYRNWDHPPLKLLQDARKRER